MSDLARLFGERPSLITNWRSRSASFPADRSTGTQPQFDVVEVVEWLRHEGPRGRTVPRLDPLLWWSTLVRAFHAQSAGPNPRRTLAALVLLRQTASRWPDLVAVALTRGDDIETMGAAVRELVDATPVGNGSTADNRSLLAEPLTLPADETPHLADLVDALDQVGAGRLAEALDIVLDIEREGRGRPLQITSTPLASIMGSLIRLDRPGVVFDPACGEGALLMACAAASDVPVTLVGQEIDESAAYIARTRFIVAGHVDHRVADPGHDSLRDDQFPDLAADAVVIDPPFADDAPPIDLWIEHGLRHVSGHGRVIISLPLSSLVRVRAARRSANRRVTTLVEGLAIDRRIESALVLPRGQRVDVVGPLVVLVLGQRTTAVQDRVPIGLLRLPTPSPRTANDLTTLVEKLSGRLRTDGVAGLRDVDDERVEVAMAESPEEIIDLLSVFGERLESGGENRVVADLGSVRFDRMQDFAALRTVRLSNQSDMIHAMPAMSPPPGRAPGAGGLDRLLQLVDELQESMEPDAYRRIRAAILALGIDTIDPMA